ncbi:hypothetical protein IV79_GL001297 [Pediococcus claussenii]|nr:hypothetical protein [Pediococcus claussenii]KRN19580.1 hypothetical protein IV79_GL001297 [Pediococcus claussenii]
MQYQKKYIRPLMTPENVYVFKFGREELNNRVIIKYTHTWTGRIKINEIDLRLHKQKHPRIFRRESDLLNYLKKHMSTENGVVRIRRKRKHRAHKSRDKETEK